MTRIAALQHRFVELIPEDLEDGMLYVSVEYGTAVHRCCCGCGEQVVTPLSPTDWKITFDGESISLNPSIGNWSFRCRSHYWIKNNRVSWAGHWSTREVDAGRARDRLNKEQRFSEMAVRGEDRIANAAATPEEVGWIAGLWRWVVTKLSIRRQ